MIAHCFNAHNIKRFLLGVGGSAFSEMGMGALSQIGLRIDKEEITPNQLLKSFPHKLELEDNSILS